MTILFIPTDSVPYYSQRTDLEGVEYVLTFEFSQREVCWYLSLSDSDGAEIVSGVKLVCNVPLLSKIQDDRAPEGLLFCIANGTDDTPPGLTDLLSSPDGRCRLTYITSDEVL